MRCGLQLGSGLRLFVLQLSLTRFCFSEPCAVSSRVDTIKCGCVTRKLVYENWTIQASECRNHPSARPNVTCNTPKSSGVHFEALRAAWHHPRVGVLLSSEKFSRCCETLWLCRLPDTLAGEWGVGHLSPQFSPRFLEHTFSLCVERLGLCTRRVKKGVF